ncbi:hypothetical protein, partial [Escherichia coli]|uniref:hypothetical protein n=1 Tax=Escherichia coli TaxID=562 RepID=UPI001BE4D01A
MGKIKIVVSDQQPFMIDGIIGFLGHYPDLYEVVGGYKDLKKAMEGANKQVISSQADSLIKISRIWADF